MSNLWIELLINVILICMKLRIKGIKPHFSSSTNWIRHIMTHIGELLVQTFSIFLTARNIDTASRIGAPFWVNWIFLLCTYVQEKTGHSARTIMIFRTKINREPILKSLNDKTFIIRLDFKKIKKLTKNILFSWWTILFPPIRRDVWFVFSFPIGRNKIVCQKTKKLLRKYLFCCFVNPFLDFIFEQGPKPLWKSCYFNSTF